MSPTEPDLPSEVNPFAAPRSQEPAYAPVVDDDLQQADLRAFVGSNAKYFLPRWGQFRGGYGFNWAAFFLGPMWMAYRKMYLVTASYIGIVSAIIVAELVVFDIILGEEMPRLLDRAINIGLAIGCGMLANSLYLKHAQRAIARAHSEESDSTARLALLRQRGGTSWLAALALLFGLIILCGSVVGVLIAMEPAVLDP